MGNKIKVGIIGCGSIAESKHLPALQACSDRCEIVAFCDSNETHARELATKYGVIGARVYTDYRELLEYKEVEAVHVLTPNNSHCPVTVAALNAGKHVMCEKPMAYTTEDAQKMLDAWRASGKKLTICYQNRFKPEVQALHQSCAEGDLGEIYYAKAHAVRRRGVPTWGVFGNKDLQGGGPLIDIGTHALDITLWMMNNYDVESVTGQVFYKLGKDPNANHGNCFGPWNTDNYEVEDSAVGFIKMKNGAVVTVEASWALNILDSREASTTLCGTKAGAELRSGMSYPKDELIYNSAEHGILLENHMTPLGNVAYHEHVEMVEGRVEIEQWIDAIINDTEPCVTPEQAFKVTEILEAIYTSAKTGEPVKFD